jgi:hypothetical protein
MQDVVWTTLITGATAVFSGGIGWLSAHQQARVELQKLKQDRDAGTAENLKFRQDLYLGYLELADVVFRFSTDGDGTPDGFFTAFNAFAQIDDRMELFAAAGVIPGRARMWTEVRRIYEKALEAPLDSGESFTDYLATSVIEMSDDYHAARRQLVQAIREDVGPGF